MEITFYLSQKFCLFSVEFFLSLRTLLYQFSDFISHIKCVFQQWNIFYCIPDRKIMWVAVAVASASIFHSVSDLCSNAIFGSSHGQTSIIACPQVSWILRYMCSSTSLMQIAIVSAFVWVTDIIPIYSLHTVISLSTQRMEITSCSMLLASVLYSAMIL